MDYSLAQALRYAATDLPFGRLLERAVRQQSGFQPTPEAQTPADNALNASHWMEQIKAADPSASHLAVRHLHNAAAVLAGTAGPEVLGEDFHSDQSPFAQFLRGKLTAPKKPQKEFNLADLPLSQSDPLSLSQEPDSPKKLLPTEKEWEPGMVPPTETPKPIEKQWEKGLQPPAPKTPKVPAALAAALRKRPIAKD